MNWESERKRFCDYTTVIDTNIFWVVVAVSFYNNEMSRFIGVCKRGRCCMTIRLFAWHEMWCRYRDARPEYMKNWWFKDHNIIRFAILVFNIIIRFLMIDFKRNQSVYFFSLWLSKDEVMNDLSNTSKWILHYHVQTNIKWKKRRYNIMYLKLKYIEKRIFVLVALSVDTRPRLWAMFLKKMYWHILYGLYDLIT